jgi:peptide/nickel transport system permease protein
LSTEPILFASDAPERAPAPAGLFGRLARDWGIVTGAVIILFMVLVGIAAPLLGTKNPSEINPAFRNRVPGVEQTIRRDDGSAAVFKYRMGTDSLGRDVYSRVVYGARISLVVGLTVALISVAVGLFIGLIAGYMRWVDAVVMRLMDGLMAIPAILLAIAVVSLFRAGLLSVIVAITVPEIPRVVRLVRSIVLSVRADRARREHAGRRAA